MILDQFGVFFDNAAAAASMISNVVNFQPYAGREDPIYISFIALGANTDTLTYSVLIEESADGSAFTAVDVRGIEKPDANPLFRSIRVPSILRQKYVRMTVAVTGTPTGTVFAGVSRDDFKPYDKGMYIDDGKVVA